MSLKGIVLLTGVAFAVTFGIVVGTRLDAAALAVIVGVSCGVGAGLPTSLMLLATLRGRARGQERERLARQTMGWGGPTPPVVVVSPQGLGLSGVEGAPHRQLPAGEWDGGYYGPNSRREFVVIGEEGINEETF